MNDDIVYTKQIHHFFFVLLNNNKLHNIMKRENNKG
jgi:hypothetical protein